MVVSTPRSVVSLLSIALSCALAACTAQSPGTGDTGGPSADPHDAYFVVSGSHEGFTCDECHDPAAGSFSLAGGGVDCLRCHGDEATSPLHGGISGYTWANEGCVSCHRAGTQPVDHARFFPIAAGATHSEVGCAECHGATKATPDLQCTTCHGHHDQPAMDGAHAGLPGYGFSSPACYECHRDGSIPAFYHSFPITAGTTHDPPIGCADCHGATRAVADLRCTTCHDHAQAATDAIHAGVAGYAYGSPACYDCHPTGSSSLPANHDTALFPVTGSQNHDVACSQCHGATKALADLTCTTCHTQPETATQHSRIPATTRGRQDGLPYVNYQWSSVYCVKCHADDQVHPISTHPPFDGGLDREGHGPFCLTCHQVARSSGMTWAASFSQFTCLACHTSNNPD